MTKTEENLSIKDKTVMSIKELQSWWEVPYIAHFCSLFRDNFNFLEFSIEDLEEALMNAENDTYTGSLPLVLQIVITILQGCLMRSDINLSNYDQYLKEFLTRKYLEEKIKPNNWEALPAFNNLPLRTKVEILHRLCDYRLEALDVPDLIKDIDGDALRLEPLGSDQSGAVYWYFYGTRLYKEVNLTKNKTNEKKTDVKSKVKKLKTKAKRRQGGRLTRSTTKTEDEDEERELPTSCGNEGWSVVCSTEEEWNKFTETFAKSTNRVEKELHKKLVEDFIPEIGKLMAEREKVLKKRLLEMAPKRVSYRIEKFKQQEKEKAEQQKLEEELLQAQTKARKIEEEFKRKERETKDRELRALERMNMKEERARRANRRRETLEYPVYDEEIKQIYSYTTSSGRTVHQHKPSMSHGTRGSTSYFENNESQRMYKVLQTVIKHKDAWPFRDPITENVAPGYFSIIKEPMDLSTIEKKLQNQLYKNCSDFEKDFHLMCDNCRIYNGVASEYTRMAESIRKLFNTVMKNAFPLLCEKDQPKLELPTSRLKIQTKSEVKVIEMQTTQPHANKINPVKLPALDTGVSTTNLTKRIVISTPSSIKPNINVNQAEVRKQSIIKLQMPQGFKHNLPIKLITSSVNTQPQQLQQTSAPKLPNLLGKNGTNTYFQSFKSVTSSAPTKIILTKSNAGFQSEAPTKTTTASGPPKFTVIKIANAKNMAINGKVCADINSNTNTSSIIKSSGTIPQANSATKRVYSVISNGYNNKVNEKNVSDEPQQKRVFIQAVEQQQQQQIPVPTQLEQTPTVIDPSHAGYCIQVPPVPPQHQIAVSTEGQQLELNGAVETILQPTYIQTQVQTQHLQYNYININQLSQQQQLVIPVNSQIVYTNPEVTNVNSLLQVYPNMVFQMASPVQQQPQQIFPVQYYDALTNGVLS